MEPTKGRAKLPLICAMIPKARGDMIPAMADPVFMMPLAVPACLGAISMGTAQIGPTVSSRKKKAALRLMAISVISCTNKSESGTAWSRGD